jgi:hypothetical protein
MKRHWIEYSDTYRMAPMSFWVHVEPAGNAWHWNGVPSNPRTDYEPPLPCPVAGKGYPIYFVEVDRCTFQFASIAELDELVRVFSERVMPTSRRLSHERRANFGPNGHWLSRLPSTAKSWKYRQKAVEVIQEAREEFVAETGGDR